MSVRRLLVLFLLVAGMLALPFPANAGPRTDAAFVRATNADRRENGLKSLPSSTTLAKLARSHSVAMARKASARYGGRCDSGPCGTTTSPSPATTGSGWARTSAAGRWAPTA